MRPGVASRTFGNSQWTGLLAAGVIVLGALMAYGNSLHAPFVLDAEASILQNQTIRGLWPLWSTFCPPNTNGETVSGRPLLDFSFALNHRRQRLGG